jgi:hypothetical protein
VTACGRAVGLSMAALAIVACHEPTRPTTGTIVIAVDGLPIPSTPVTLTGPNAFSQTIGTTRVFEQMPPGAYTLSVNTVRTSTTVYGTGIQTRTIELVAGKRDSTLVHFAPITGSLTVLLALPGNVTPTVHVRGPGAFDRTIRSSALITDLESGSYTVSADTVTASGYMYASEPALRAVTVEASAIPARVTLNIIAITGSLAISVSGLPSGATTSASVVGPNGYSRTITTSTTLTGLTTGYYTTTAADVSADGLTWRAGATGSAVAFVGTGKTANAALDFVPLATDGSVLPNVRVDGFTVTQVVQRDDNSIPMVSGRGARLRVRVLASTANTARPPVRVRYFMNGTLTDSSTIDATLDAVPTTRPTDPLTGTWDVVVPSALVRPGLGIQVEVDPTRQIAQATHTDDVFPIAGPQSISVRTGATPAVRLVPILQSANGLLGDLDTHSADDYLAFLKRVYPIAGYDGDLRVKYTTTGPPLDAHDTTGAWERILTELEALRVAENSSRHYYGVVDVPYPSGVAGLGFVGGKTAIGWDHWESNYVSTPAMILAHEMGHNFGRWHSPGCGAGGVDPLYPYPNGTIGVTGWDSVSGTLIAPSTADLMSYCHPEWISDYTYTGVFDALSGPAATIAATHIGASPEPCLLVWGRIQNGVPVLEPAFEVRTRAVLPARTGSHALHVLDEQGGEVFSLSFEAQLIADLPDARSFAFAIPLSRFAGRRVGELRLSARGREVRSLALPQLPGGPALDPELRASRGTRGIDLHWNAERFPMVMVRDAVTGAVLSFARHGEARVWSQRSDVELVFSDRVRSTSRRVSVR